MNYVYLTIKCRHFALQIQIDSYLLTEHTHHLNFYALKRINAEGLISSSFVFIEHHIGNPQLTRLIYELHNTSFTETVA